MLAETNKGGGIAQDKLMRAGKLSERILDEIDVGIVGDAEFEIETADFLCAVIGDGLIGKRSVWDRDNLIVHGFKRRIEDADIGDGAAVRFVFDIISDRERLENEDHDSSCEIG